MPIYEYRCESCGFQKEYLQKAADANKTSCPQCGSASYNKLISAAGFQLKGSGWYATDFKTKKKDERKSPDETKPVGEGEKSASDGGSKKAAAQCGAGACPACE